MCDKRMFKRFAKIYDFISNSRDCRYTQDNNHAYYKYKIFNTKMGNRKIEIIALDNYSAFVLTYHDGDDSVLFSLLVDKRGKITIFKSVIDEIAIFSAIYELECLIYNKKIEKMDGFLEKMLSYYNPLGESWLGFIWKK